MRLNGWGAIWLGFLGLVIVISHGHDVQAKASPVHPEKATHVIHKRNAWWSKKSTDEVNRIATGRSLALQRSSMEDIQEATRCYVNICVPDFVECSRHTQLQSSFLKCKLEHSLCAKGCFSTDALLDDKQ